MEQQRYSSCAYCGSNVTEQLVRMDMWFGDQLLIFEHVPTGVCDICGEEYLRPDVQDRMIALAHMPPKSTIQVPVHAFSEGDGKQKSKRGPAREIQTREPDVLLATDDELSQLMETDLEEWEDL
jgi:YgiT-type zinc finger domain-containing protein